MKDGIMIDLQRISRQDPLDRGAERQEENPEFSPMAPPEAYAPPATLEEIPYEELPGVLQKFRDEHEECLEKLKAFEEIVLSFRQKDFCPGPQMERELGHFFAYFDKILTPHNRREEKILFSLLHERLMETGEHGPDEKTAVTVLEGDHEHFLQLAALSFNFFGLAFRLPDPASRLMVLDAALEQSLALIEELRLHIFREDEIVFQLAARLISRDEFEEMQEDCCGGTCSCS